MARYELKLPEMGESVAEATITNWLKEIGDTVEADESIVEVATDKVDSEVPSEVSGVLVEILCEPDQVVKVGEVMAIIETDTGVSDTQENIPPIQIKSLLQEVEQESEVTNEKSEGEKEVELQGHSNSEVEKPEEKSLEDSNKEEFEEKIEPTEVKEIEKSITDIQKEVASSPLKKETEEKVSEQEKDDEYYLNKFYSPLVRSIAKEEGVTLHELNKILGTGLDGRVTKQDILMYIESRVEPAKKQEEKVTPVVSTVETERSSSIQEEAPEVLTSKIEESSPIEVKEEFDLEVEKQEVEERETITNLQDESSSDSQTQYQQFIGDSALDKEEIGSDVEVTTSSSEKTENPFIIEDEGVQDNPLEETQELEEEIHSDSTTFKNPFIIEDEDDKLDIVKEQEKELQTESNEVKNLFIIEEEEDTLENIQESKEDIQSDLTTTVENSFTVENKDADLEEVKKEDVGTESNEVRNPFIVEDDVKEEEPTKKEPIFAKQHSFTKVELKETQEEDEIIPMSRMGKLIAEHMTRSKQTSAHVQSFSEADVTRIWNWRNRVKQKFEAREKQKFTFTPIFISAVAKAIQDFPLINISLEGENIIKKRDINIGMATALPDGNLIVPVIKNADRLSLTEMAKVVNDLAERARNNQLKPDEVRGGTYTVTNIGSFGNVFGTPIINQPQVGILALGAIRKLPSVVETPTGDAIAIRYKMMLSHSYDHRVVNGALGGMFVQRVAEYLEKWDIEREV